MPRSTISLWAVKWAAGTGDEAYTLPNLLPYYIKGVNYTPPTIPYPNSTKGSVFDAGGGPLHVSHGRYNDPLQHGCFMRSR